MYVLGGVSQGLIARSWKLWELGGPPVFAFEVVSLDVDKDTIVAPAIHAEIGTRELVLFDPENKNDPERHIWQVFRRVRGIFRVVERGDGDRVRSRELGCFLRTVGAGAAFRVRIATGPRGDVLFPTEAERERAEKEQARATGAQERARRVAAESEVEALRRQLASLRRERPRKKT